MVRLELCVIFTRYAGCNLSVQAFIGILYCEHIIYNFVCSFLIDKKDHTNDAEGKLTQRKRDPNHVFTSLFVRKKYNNSIRVLKCAVGGRKL